jgi:protein-S-isoprenylcysteine O-methyltransferase Ste14
MSNGAAHTRPWQTFEAVFGVPLLLAIGLQIVLPLAPPRAPLRLLCILGGVGLIVVGLAFVTQARREFAGRNQPTDPGRAATEVVTTGVFSISRNPLYLGGVCFLLGAALAAGLLWELVLLPPSVLACYYILIAPEERYLLGKFSDQYSEYARTVHRWFGRKSNRLGV